MRSAIVSILFSLALAAQADIIKCKMSDGSIVYQSRPCDGGTAVKTVKIDKLQSDEETVKRLRAQVQAADQHFSDKAKQEQADVADRLDRSIRKREVAAREREAAAGERSATAQEDIADALRYRRR